MSETRRPEQHEVTAEMTAWAVKLDREHHPLNWTARRAFGDVLVEAKVEPHTHQGSTGKRFDPPQPHVSLFFVDEAAEPMRTSAAGLEFITRWEGEVLHVYEDVAKIPTIGVGHVVLAGESFPDGITHERAQELLAADVASAEAAVHKLAASTEFRGREPLAQCEFDALVSFAFNVGAGAFAKSTLAKKLAAGDRKAAAAEFLKWDKAGGKPVAGLHNRRVAERALFLGAEASPMADSTPPPVLAQTKSSPGEDDRHEATTFDVDTVLGLQRALNALGASPPLVEDGVRGPKTTAALKVFQRLRGLVPDAIVGPKTRAKFAEALAPA